MNIFIWDSSTHTFFENLDAFCKWNNFHLGSYCSLLKLSEYVFLGYSVFVVSGNLPVCEADRKLQLIPRESLIQKKWRPNANSSQGPIDKDLQMALEESRRLYEVEGKLY